MRHGETLDSIVFPDLLVFQKRRGYRFGLDPVILAGCIDPPPPGPIIDLGCGTAVVALLLARRFPSLSLTGLEIQADLVSLAGRNAVLNRLDGRIRILGGDIREAATLFPRGAFRTVVSNPPYRKAGSGRIPSDRERAVARHEILMTIEDLAAAAGHLLSMRGSLWFTWKPERAAELPGALLAEGLSLVSIRQVSPRREDDPFLLVCRAARAGNTPPRPRRLRPLAVRQGDTYTREMASLLGHGRLPWSRRS
jgi:tRNA1Val (adenine37-N6)-methyltransferase